MVRPERFELPAFWFVARRSIQLSYGRISVATVFQQLTACSAFSSTAAIGYLKKPEIAPGLKRLFGNSVSVRVAPAFRRASA